MMGAHFVVGLDVGTSRTCAVIGELSGEVGRHPVVKILGVGQTRTGGVSHEGVTHIEATADSIRVAMKEAELMSGMAPDRLYVGLPAAHVQVRSSPGVVALGGMEITRDDVERVHEVARAVALPANWELLHAIPQEYTVDHQGRIKDPVGMSGIRLETEVFLVSCDTIPATNLRKAVAKAGYRVQELVAEPLAAARSAVTEDEKELGVVLVEFGACSTDCVVFHEGQIVHLGSVPFGGATLTNDLVKGLNLPFAEARKAMEAYGAAHTSLVDPNEMVELPGPAPGQVRPVARELIAHVMEQRLDEILEMIHRDLEERGLLRLLGAGVVLSGGTATLQGILEVTQQVFATPVRLGIPSEGLTGLAESVGRPRFAVATGLALYGAERFHETGRGVSTSSSGVASRVGAWLKEFF